MGIAYIPSDNNDKIPDYPYNLRYKYEGITDPRSPQQKAKDIANWYILHPQPDLPNNSGGSGGGSSNNIETQKTRNTDLIKLATLNDFVETYFKSQTNLSTEEQLAFNALTSIDILQTVRNNDISSSSITLNKNIIDVVDVVNSFSPTEIIKLQKTNKNYFSQFYSNLQGYSASIDNNTGIATISVPKTSGTGSYRVQIQTMTPTVIKSGTIY